MGRDLYEFEITLTEGAIQNIQFKRKPKVVHCVVTGEPVRCETEDGPGWSVPVRWFRTWLGARLYWTRLKINDKLKNHNKTTVQ